VATEAKAERPLWRKIWDFPLVAMVIATVVYIAAAALGLFLGKYVPADLGKTGVMAIHAVITIGLLLVAYKLVIVRLGRHPRDDLPGGPALREGAIGVGIGFAIMAATVGVAAVIGIYRIIGMGDASMFWMSLIATAIMPGFTEELLFRGILMRWLEEFGGSWFGLVVSSLLFGFAHYFNPNSTVLACLWIAIEAGILLGGAYMLTRNLWLAIGLHAGWNFTQGEIFDVPVSGLDEHGLVQASLSGPQLLSGGEFGLEASIIALVIATATGIWLIVLAARRGRLVRPIWVS
jgi:hypothetical protein